jgi:hypothetical protein
MGPNELYFTIYVLFYYCPTPASKDSNLATNMKQK